MVDQQESLAFKSQLKSLLDNSFNRSNDQEPYQRLSKVSEISTVLNLPDPSLKEKELQCQVRNYLQLRKTLQSNENTAKFLQQKAYLDQDLQDRVDIQHDLEARAIQQTKQDLKKAGQSYQLFNNQLQLLFQAQSSQEIPVSKEAQIIQEKFQKRAKEIDDFTYFKENYDLEYQLDKKKGVNRKLQKRHLRDKLELEALDRKELVKGSQKKKKRDMKMVFKHL